MMASGRISDYLTKRLFIENNVVTYRSLSRELAMHVNVAKEELKTFHTTSDQKSYAIYCVSGEVMPSQQQIGTHDDEAMELDDEDDFDDGEEVLETRIVLVAEDSLQDAKLQFSRVHGEHVYCLSPSPLRDPALITGPASGIRQADAMGGPEWVTTVGRGVRASVKASPASAKSKSKGKMPTTTSTSATATKGTGPVAPPTVISKSSSNEQKAKSTGKLDWSKAKPKEVVKKETIDMKMNVDPPTNKSKIMATKPSAPTTTLAPETRDEVVKPSLMSLKVEPTGKDPKTGASKRGMKRKSNTALVSDSDEETDAPKAPVKAPTKAGTSASTKAKAKTSAILSDDDEPQSKSKAKAPAASGRLKGRVILSDDEDDEPAPAKAPAKGRGRAKVAPVRDSDDEEDLKAMMDLDDDQVTRASIRPSLPPDTDPEDSATGPDDVDMADADDVDDALEDDVPKPIKTRKKREKKVVPVGQNGLPKRRVEKTRTAVDAKGFMMTEDYSDYESVDEEDVEVHSKPAKTKGIAKAPLKRAASSASTKDVNPKPKPKPKPKEPTKSGSSAAAKKESGGSGTTAKGQAGQKNLTSFFGKGKQ